MFKLNPNLKIDTERLYGTTIFYIRDFYENPDEVYEYLFNKERPLTKKDIEHQQLIDFGNRLNNISESPVIDRRVEVFNPHIFKVTKFLSGLCGQACAENSALGNMASFADSYSNDFRNCVFWPHRDIGYNGVLYLNKGTVDCGTNLYHPSVLKTDKWKENQESIVAKVLEPWQPKDDYSILKTIPSEYNMIALFDGYKFPHGANFSSDYYFIHSESRCNQVFFFDRDRPVKKVAQSPWWKVWDRV